MIVIIDYQAGNPASVQNMIKKIGYEAEISNVPELINKANKIIIPGVGRFNYGAVKLKEPGLIEVLNNKVLKEKVPVLGICLGFQLMTRGSEEGKEKGFGWLQADAIKFSSDNQSYKVPHMGWNSVEYDKRSPLFTNFSDGARFYFVHSYYVKADIESDVTGITDYGLLFSSAMQRDNIFGVQFHPEKSHKFGMQLMTNFIKL
jgi:imidazole glycerol-phosphate synthase subunit HisH